MPFAKITAEASTGNWTQATTTDVDFKNVYISNSVATEIVYVLSGTAAAENTANRVAYNPTTGITILTNVNPSKIYIRAQGASQGGAYIRWE